MTRNVVTRALLVLLGGVVVIAALLALSGTVTSGGMLANDGQPTAVTVNGPAVVEAGETVDSLTVVNGRAVVRGTVEGPVTVLNGGISITGDVAGDVRVVRGGVWLGADAIVDGDVSASRAINFADGAIVGGVAEEVSVTTGIVAVIRSLGLPLWLSMTIALLALGTVGVSLAGRLTDDSRRKLRERPFGSAVAGVALLAGVLVAAALALGTIVGGLLGLLLLALGLLLVLAGLAITATALGRWVLPNRSNLAAFLLGSVALRILALLPIAGTVITLVAEIAGAGALLLALAGRTRSSADAETTATTDPADDHLHEDDMATIDPHSDDTRSPFGPTAAEAPVANGNGVVHDFRPGHVPAGEPGRESEPVGTSWLDEVLSSGTAARPTVDVREPAPLIDLTGTAPVPPPRRDDQPLFGDTTEPAGRPEVIAALPVRDEHYADDPAGPPGNGARQELFVEDSPPAPAPARVGGVPLFRGGEAEEAPVPAAAPSVPEGRSLFREPPGRSPGLTEETPAESPPLFRPPVEPTPTPPPAGLGDAPTPLPRPNVRVEPFEVVRNGSAEETQGIFGSGRTPGRDRLFLDQPTPNGERAWRPGRD